MDEQRAVCMTLHCELASRCEWSAWHVPAEGTLQGVARISPSPAFEVGDCEHFRERGALALADEAGAGALSACGELEATPLFVPLNREFFEAFADGSKREEYRLYGRWNERTCAIGRRVVLSCGYGKGRRLAGVVTSFRVDDTPWHLPGWKACYGDDEGPAAVIGIRVDNLKSRMCPKCCNAAIREGLAVAGKVCPGCSPFFGKGKDV